MTPGVAMQCYLVHHADAVGPEVDAQRPLSIRGLAHAERLAEAAREASIKPSAIWHSGKLRARQTAEAFLRVCNPFASFKAVRGLRPEDPPGWIREVLAAEDEGEMPGVLLVGHMPHLPALLHALTEGAAEFPLHGLVWLERGASGIFRERKRWKDGWI